MSRTSSGTYTQPSSTTAVFGATIDPTAFNTLISDLGNELTNSLDRGGRGAMTAALNAGGFKLTNAADPTLSTDVATKGYVDGLSGVADGSITNAKLANMAATTIKANLSGSAAAATDKTLTQILDGVAGSSQGSILYRSGSAWTALGTGTSGQFLQTQGAAANPVWGNANNLVRRYYAENATYTTLTATMNANDTLPTTAQGTQVLSVTVTVDDATEVVRLRFTAGASISSATYMVAAIFQGSTAVAADAFYQPNTAIAPMLLEKEITPGAAGTYTYSVRIGPTSGTMYLNGSTSSRFFGGAMVATLVAQVVKP